jgi:membrane protein DedA with SNARE-associated domain
MFSPQALTDLVHTHSYGLVALFVGLECIGLPLPGEVVLIAAAVYAGTSHELNIVLVIVAATGGAIVGNLIGFWIGRRGGYRLLVRHGHRVRLTAGRIKLGQYLFRRHGGKIVFFSRFVTLLRAFGALLAGANRMNARAFVLYTTAGSAAWATLYGALAYYLGEKIGFLTKYAEIAAAVAAIVIIIVVFVFLRRQEAQLQIEAERALPGPLEPP